MKITISSIIACDRETVWNAYTTPADITQWNFASEDWCCPSASNDMKVGGLYSARMEAKDGSQGFDFEAKYKSLEPGISFCYVLSDGREVNFELEQITDGTSVTIVFDAENQYPPEYQKQGWQSILDNFRKYVERS